MTKYYLGKNECGVNCAFMADEIGVASCVVIADGDAQTESYWLNFLKQRTPEQDRECAESLLAAYEKIKGEEFTRHACRQVSDFHCVREIGVQP